jgi:glycosyltransferase involved in cell wall biosynthesis
MIEAAKTPNVILLSKRWQHHTSSGGYDRLADFLSHPVIQRKPLTRLGRLERRVAGRWWAPPPMLVDYGYADVAAERRAFASAWLNRARVVHVLYGDEQLDLLLRLRRWLPAKLVATFHLPWFRSRQRFEAQRELLSRSVDHFIAVSSDLATDLAAMFGEHRVSFVPHGIDTEVFRPTLCSRQDGPLRLLTVGFHMRDLELVHRVADKSAHAGLPVRFQFVGPSHIAPAFIGCDNVEVFSDIDESTLIRMYQDADAALLPVTAATANNALLEAIACGTPVISTDVGGIRDYLDDRAGWLLPKGDCAALMELVDRLNASPDLCSLKKSSARELAETFAWPRVAAQCERVYAQVIGEQDK